MSDRYVGDILSRSCKNMSHGDTTNFYDINSRRNVVGTLTKIGRKYYTFTINSRAVLFDKISLRQKPTGYGVGYDYRMLGTDADMVCIRERENLVKFLENVDWSRYDSTSLRRIEDILGKYGAGGER